MSNVKVENILYFKAGLAFDSYKQALKAFETYLANPQAGATPEYYKARNYLRDADKFFGEALAEEG